VSSRIVLRSDAANSLSFSQAGPLEVNANLHIMGRWSIVAWQSGTSIDSQDALSFSVLTGVRVMTEVFPLERASEAYEHRMSGKALFRVGLTNGAWRKCCRRF
jgi:D-arabinose 1-dehydrogenase-like Zn-dependent alcohol dehydrogenase